MKKYLFLDLASFLCIWALCFGLILPAGAETDLERRIAALNASGNEHITSDGYHYRLDLEGGATITKYTGPENAVDIPIHLEGHPVTGIADDGLSGGVHPQVLSFPDTLRRIGARAFPGGNGQELVLHAGLTELDISVFLGYGKLKNIWVEEGNTAYTSRDGVLYDQSGETLLLFPRGREGTYDVPEGTKRIGKNAFNLTRLTEIHLPASVERMDPFGFGTSLLQLSVDPHHPVLICEDNVLYDICTKTLVYCGPGKSGTYAIPEGTLRIEEEAFAWCGGLTEIVIPESVLEIGDAAFSNCKDLVEMYIPDNVTKIGKYAFEGCLALQSLSIPANIRELGEGFAASCFRLEAFEFRGTGDRYEWINGALYDNQEKALLLVQQMEDSDTFTVRKGTRHIGASAFVIRNHFVGVNLPQSLRSIGSFAFEYNQNLTEIDIPFGVTELKWGTFGACLELVAVRLPEGMTSIEGEVFRDCVKLSEISLPDSITSISDWAFDGCEALGMR